MKDSWNPKSTFDEIIKSGFPNVTLSMKSKKKK